MKFLEAALARLIPADELGPGAKEAGVVVFIDRQLEGDFGTMAREYRRGPFADLTATEARVLRLLVGGRTTKEIAAELVVAVSTVDRHLTHIYQKLGVRNRAAATAFALRHGLV